MLTRESRVGERGTSEDGHLSAVLPIDRGAIESISWRLGTRLTGDEPCLLTLSNQRTTSSLAVFEATDFTCIVRFRTPVGREKFFGVAAVDLRTMLESLLDHGEWTIDHGDFDTL
ncbi:MAG: hypothetical protein ACOCR6_02160 [archaeon]